MNCEFSDPVNLGTDSWAYSSMECVLSESEIPIELVSSGDGEFYIDKTLNYGDIITITFLSLFLGLIILKTVSSLVFKEKN
jgi:hypothetical protein